ncbi:YheC/YheD family protein [Halalkalibacter krulwichiae]|uniref:Endospore coat-associated protein YheD n=1 Tax=Halalkalibacter krulwichiae TaxID=199441 RepID=A0A1X9MM27_9BACI|nr:YheC/YheD family protein [Halalkalibacter krulwichiae]ARK32092.1 Endospore coat-associated protein YheD [Halalkalibacter krulwichiae]
MKQREKLLFQSGKIIETLIEAGDHFQVVAREMKFNETILIFSSIVEGFGAIEKNLRDLALANGYMQNNIEKIKKTISLITTLIEERNLIKVSEVMQFTLMPQLQQWKEVLDEEDFYSRGEQHSITIGIYLCQENPINKIRPERVSALLKESKKRDIKLIFFSSKAVDFNLKQIKANVYDDGEWIIESVPFPEVIYNISPKARVYWSRTERRLRREIPFTCFNIGDKFHLPKKIVESRKYDELLIPFKIIAKETTLKSFLNVNKRIVVKPIKGSQGNNIYFIEKKGKRFSILEHQKQHILSEEELNHWIKEEFLQEKVYIVQKYVECRTKNDEPYDIRAHVQKNGEGKWEITKVYPRIGNRKTILSNISRGGKVISLTDLLYREFGKAGNKYEKALIDLSLGLTKHIDKLYGFSFDELGLDLAIDENGRFWLHEVNTSPQSTFHEEERAVKTIAYAEYVGKNQLFFINEFNKKVNTDGQFDVLKTKLEKVESDGRYRIGMLVSESENNNLAIACAYVAKYEDVQFFYFTPKDIDYDEMLIRGYYYEDKKWIPKIVEYPHAIYDRLRLRGMKSYSHIYEEFEGIPFTNEFFGNSISKLEVYDKLNLSNALDENIIPYKKVERVKDIFDFLNKYGKIIVKPEVGSFANGVHFIEKKNIDNYFLALGEIERTYSEMYLTQYLREILKNGKFIVQKYIESRTIDNQPFDIRVHMMKNEKNDWSFVNIHPRVGVYHAVILVLRKGGYIGKLSSFLERNFGKDIYINIESEVRTLSLNVAVEFERLYEERINEIGLDIAVDKELKLKLIEVNVNKPGFINYEFELAKHAIPYAIKLAEKKL